MDPLITLALGAVVGSGVSGFLVWLGTRQPRPDSSGELSRTLRDLVGRGILPSQVWEHISRELRGNTTLAPNQRQLGYQTEPEDAFLGSGTKFKQIPLFALWLTAGILAFFNLEETNWVLAGSFSLLSLATWAISSFFTRLNRFWATTGLALSCLAAWIIAALSSQGSGADPQKLLANGWWGLVSGISVLLSLRFFLTRRAPGSYWTPLIGTLLFAPTFLLPADWARWNPTERAWSEVLAGPWAFLAGISWSYLIAVSWGFKRRGLAVSLAVCCLWITGWAALSLSGKSVGFGLPSAMWVGLAGALFTAGIQAVFLGNRANGISPRFPFGPWGMGGSLFLASLVLVGTMVWTGVPLSKSGGFLLAATLVAWLNLLLVRHPVWGIGLTGVFAAAIHLFSVSIHNGVPMAAWWPFEAKALGLALSLATLFWCLAVWQFPARKWGVVVSLLSLVGCLAWLLPTQALVMATLVEPSWMSEVIRAPLAGWWNWPLAIFSVVFAWFLHRGTVSSRPEIWLTIFILIGGGLATAGATLGLDTEESPQGVLAVLATWTVGSFLLGLFKSQWASFFSTLFASFAWFLAWSQPERLPGGSHLWSLVPGLVAWGTGITQALIHGKRWLPLACFGSLMVALSTWSAFESVDLGPGILIGSLLMASCLVSLELRYSRDWLAPNGFKKTLRLREPSFWLATTQVLVLAGSFLSIRESTYDWWLPVAIANQAAILWLVRGNSSSTLANLQSLGASLTGGLAVMGIGEVLRRYGGWGEIMAGVSPLTVFVPGTLIGLGIRQSFLLAGLVRGKGRTLGVLVLLGILVVRIIADLSPGSVPLFEFGIVLFSSAMWVMLAWAGSVLEEKNGSGFSKYWYQVALACAPVPLSLFFMGMGNPGFLAAGSLLGSVILSVSLIATLCLAVPFVETNWTLQQRQSFGPSMRRLVGFSLAVQVGLVSLALCQREQSGLNGFDLQATIGFLITGVVAAISANHQKGHAKVLRLQGFSLATACFLVIWICTVGAPSPSISRAITLGLGSALVLLGALGTPALSPALRRWETALQVAGLSLPLAAALFAGISFNPLVDGTRLQGAWGIFHPSVSFEKGILHACLFSLLLGILGIIAPAKSIHLAIRTAFAPWAMAGWIGLCLATQGFSTEGILLCLVGFIAGALMAVRVKEQNSGIIPRGTHREAA